MDHGGSDGSIKHAADAIARQKGESTMKKLFALLLPLALLFSLAACGGGGDEKPPSNDDPPASGQQQQQNTPDPDEGEDEPEQTPDDGGEASLDHVTDSNYAALAKELFGIDADPEGDWELVKAESTLTIGGGMVIVYQGAAAVDTKELMKAYYDATAAISTAGICIGQFDSISEPFADFDAFFEEGTKAGGSVGEWIYEYGGKKIELMFALSPEMELTLTINYLAENKYS